MFKMTIQKNSKKKKLIFILFGANKILQLFGMVIRITLHNLIQFMFSENTKLFPKVTLSFIPYLVKSIFK